MASARPRNTGRINLGVATRTRKVRAKFDELGTSVQRELASGRIENSVVASVRRRFAPAGSNPQAQRDPAGVPWKGVSPVTQQISARRGRPAIGGRALFSTGSLRDSVQVIRGSLDRGLATNTGASVRIGIPASARNAEGQSLEIIGASHQFGATIKVFGRGSARLPPRVFLGISDLDVKNITSIMDRVIKRAANAPAGTAPRVRRARRLRRRR